MVIGILLPLSTTYPLIGRQFTDGLTSCLEENNIHHSIIIKKESIGFGGDEKDVFAKAEKLLISDDVDVLIAYVDEKVVSILSPLVQATGKLMIVVNPGANYPINWIPQTSVARISLQHAFCCWLSGGLAAKSDNGQAVMSSTFYDCGYMHTAGMVQNFTDSGGEIVFNYINKQAYDEAFDINELDTFLQANHSCQNLLCTFDEKAALLFYKRLSAIQTVQPLHVFASPMMLQPSALERNEDGFPFSIKGFIPWYADIQNEANQTFTKSCKIPPTIFSLLGWEAALVINEIMKSNSRNFADGEAVVVHLKNSPFQSPRGEMMMDEETQIYIAPVSKVSVGKGSPVINMMEQSELKEQWNTFTKMPTDGAEAGWTNTYLCY